MEHRLLICVAVIVVAILAFKTLCSSSSRENYIDPIWMNKKKIWDDYYPRSNGSIYGNYQQPWDMFTGYPTFPKAY